MRSTGSRLFVVWATSMAVFVALMGTWLSLSLSAKAVSRDDGHVTQMATVSLILSETTVDWHGRPVFEVTNRSNMQLSHVAVKTLSDELLPILSIGQTAPSAWPSKNSDLLRPPYLLHANSSLWFVGTHASPAAFEVFWIDHGKSKYEVVSVGEA